MDWWLVLVAVGAWILTGIILGGGNDYPNERMPYWWKRFK
jgi:hypothetical protein